jgi:hypothetical protein
MRLKIISYNKDTREHTLENEKGYYKCDIMVNSPLGEEMADRFEHATIEEIYAYEASLVGKTLEVDSLSPYRYFADGAKLID